MEILDYAKIKQKLNGVVVATIVENGEVKLTYIDSVWLSEDEAVRAINCEIKAFAQNVEPHTEFYCEQNLPDKAVIKIGNRTLIFTVCKIDSFVRKYKIGNSLVEHL